VIVKGSLSPSLSYRVQAKSYFSVKIGAGSRWVDVLEILEPENLMVLSGRVADVGVGGFTLGGGISYYSNEHGWACDSVLAYEIVLPDGTIKNKVTHTSDPNLYKALRGAGQANFGVVTSFTFEAFEPKTKGLWFATRSYSWDQIVALTDLHLQYFQSPTNLVQHTGGFQAFFYMAAYNMFMATDFLVHTNHDNSETWPEVFAPFQAVEAMPQTESTSIRSFSNLTEEIKLYNPYGK
jgi:hypothetical protein